MNTFGEWTCQLYVKEICYNFFRVLYTFERGFQKSLSWDRPSVLLSIRGKQVKTFILNQCIYGAKFKRSFIILFLVNLSHLKKIIMKNTHNIDINLTPTKHS